MKIFIINILTTLLFLVSDVVATGGVLRIKNETNVDFTLSEIANDHSVLKKVLADGKKVDAKNGLKFKEKLSISYEVFASSKNGDGIKLCTPSDTFVITWDYIDRYDYAPSVTDGNGDYVLVRENLLGTGFNFVVKSKKDAESFVLQLIENGSSDEEIRQQVSLSTRGIQDLRNKKLLNPLKS
jgi:predicted DNA-binding protein YlxM (UPF0122 family)